MERTVRARRWHRLPSRTVLGTAVAWRVNPFRRAAGSTGSIRGIGAPSSAAVRRTAAINRSSEAITSSVPFHDIGYAGEVVESQLLWSVWDGRRDGSSRGESVGGHRYSTGGRPGPQRRVRAFVVALPGWRWPTSSSTRPSPLTQGQRFLSRWPSFGPTQSSQAPRTPHRHRPGHRAGPITRKRSCLQIPDPQELL
jgi:hypothetical protein